MGGFYNDILEWYDRHRRVLPWRAEAGKKPDSYHVWLSEIMLQQTVVAAVIPYFQKFVDKWPTIHDLADADPDALMAAWAGLGYYARARNLHKAAKMISDTYSGIFPDTEQALKKLPGIGDYTSAAIIAIAHDKPAVVIDGNVERVMSRFFVIESQMPAAKAEIRRYAVQIYDPAHNRRPGDLAQAIMDLGAGICTPQSPSCGNCPVQSRCRIILEAASPEEYPRKAIKKTKKQRRGYIYHIETEAGEVLLEKRAEKGLLGGMTGFPTSEWVTGSSYPDHPGWLEGLSPAPIKNVLIKHVFTHFELSMKACRLRVADKDSIRNLPATYIWRSKSAVIDRKNDFPTIFRKFVPFINS